MKRIFSGLTLALSVAALLPPTVSAQADASTQFAGNWCAQGNPSRPESITSRGPLEVHFENYNDVPATGSVSGPNAHEVVVPEWKYIRGALSSDGQTINWSNRTFWKRCTSTVKK